MAFAPVEIRHLSPPRGVLGYRRRAVDRLLTEIAESFEDVWRDRAALVEKVEQLEADLTRHRELESLLRTTLVSAERAAHELRDQAKREAEAIVQEAHAAGREITREAFARREELVLEARRVRLVLHAALDALDEAETELEPAAAEPEAA